MIKRIIDSSEIEKFKAAIGGVSRIVITCHKKADGDAIGSSLAMCRVLRNMGKNAIVIIPDQLPASLSFVAEGVDYFTFSHSEITASNIIRNTQLIISLDYNDFSRVDKMQPLLENATVPKVLIDHHLNPRGKFDVMFSFPELSSTCELVYRIVEEAGWQQYLDNEVMAQLMRYGIDKPYLYKMAMDTVPLNSLLLQSYALLNKMTVIDNSIALITLDKEDLQKYNYHTGDTERLVNKPLSVKEIYWSTFMREDPNYIKVSMRSEGDFAVDVLCSRYFNGGGHMHAAAGEFYGTMQEAVELYYKIVEEVKQNKQ